MLTANTHPGAGAPTNCEHIEVGTRASWHCDFHQNTCWGPGVGPAVMPVGPMPDLVSPLCPLMTLSKQPLSGCQTPDVTVGVRRASGTPKGLNVPFVTT